MIKTFTEFKQADVSEKLMVAHLEPGRRLMTWTVHSGSVYKKVVEQYVVDLYENGNQLTKVTSIANVNGAGKWFFDSDTYTVYLWSTDGGDPGDKDHFTMAIVRLFIANVPIDLPYDLESGKEVPYEGIIEGSSQFGAELDQERKGTALESTGTLTLYNAEGSLDLTFDRYIWEGKRVAIYLMPLVSDREPLLDEKLLLFRGLIVNKDFASYTITFELANFIYSLRSDVDLPRFTSADFGPGEVNSDLLPSDGEGAFKRRIYGRVAGLQLSSLEKVEDVGIKLTGSFSTATNPVYINTYTFTEGSGSANEVQIVSFYDSPSFTNTLEPQGGYFTLVFDGQETARIPYNANADLVFLELNALANIDLVMVSGSFATGFVIEFQGTQALTNVPQITKGANTLVVYDTTRVTFTGAQVHQELSPGDELAAFDDDRNTITSVTVLTLSRIDIDATSQMTVDLVKHPSDPHSDLVGVSSQFDTTVVSAVLAAGGTVYLAIKGRNFKAANKGVWRVMSVEAPGVMRIERADGVLGATDTNVAINDNESSYDITVVTNNDFAITLAGELDPVANKVVWAIPNTPSTSKNRKFFVAHHICSQPSTTATVVDGPNQRLTVASTQGLTVGDYVILDGTYEVVLDRIDGNTLYFAKVEASDPDIQTVIGSMTVGDSVVRPAIQRLYHSKPVTGIKDKPFVTRFKGGRDFSVSNTTNGLTVTITANSEFNNAGSTLISAEPYWTNGSSLVFSLNGGFQSLRRESNVTGSRAWLSPNGGTTWYEIEEIVDTQIVILRTPYSGTSNKYETSSRYVEYVTDSSTLSADVYGMTTNLADSQAPLIRTPADVVKHQLEEAGLADQINTTLFEEASVNANYLVSLMLPLAGEALAGVVTENGSVSGITRRDVIGLMNDTVFGTLFNNLDFEICYKVLTADRPKSEVTRLDDTDVIDWKIDVYSDRIVRFVDAAYQHGDINYQTLKGPYNQVTTYDNQDVRYTKRSNEKLIVNVYLYNQSEAAYMANKYGFINSNSANLISVRTKLQTIDLKLNDLVSVRFDRLFERFGSITGSRERIGVVNSIKKTENGVELTIDDLGNLFARGGSIADDGSFDWSLTDIEDRLYGLWLTNDNGLIGSDDDSQGLNLLS